MLLRKHIDDCLYAKVLGDYCIWDAVGTSVAGCPPHRSVRAELPHTVPTLGLQRQSLIGVWMFDLGWRYPRLFQTLHPLPGHTFAFLAATSQGLQPGAADFPAEDL